MSAVIIEFRRARAPTPCARAGAHASLFRAPAHLFGLSIYLALTPARVWAAALSPWRM